jgi:hypothetical protein
VAAYLSVQGHELRLNRCFARDAAEVGYAAPGVVDRQRR